MSVTINGAVSNFTFDTTGRSQVNIGGAAMLLLMIAAAVMPGRRGGRG